MDYYCWWIVGASFISFFLGSFLMFRAENTFKERAENAEFMLSVKDMDSKTDIALAVFQATTKLTVSHAENCSKWQKRVLELSHKIKVLESQKCNCKGEVNEQV